MKFAMVSVVKASRPDVIDLIEDAARKLTGGNKTVALAMGGLPAKTERTGSLFGAHPGSAHFAEGYDPLAPALEVVPDAVSGKEIDSCEEIFASIRILRFGWTMETRICD